MELTENDLMRLYDAMESVSTPLCLLPGELDIDAEDREHDNLMERIHEAISCQS